MVFPPLTRARHGVHMKSYNYKPYDPYKPYDYTRAEGLYWKVQSRWKKNRPLCGAKCRDGHACKAKAVINPKTDEVINGRCRFHGGLSCGPKTPEGKARSKEAARQGMLNYWQKKKTQQP